MSTSLARVTISFDQDIVNARQLAWIIAEMLGFRRQEQTSISTATSEIARNALQYGKGGEAEFLIEGEAPAQWLAISIRDHGPGIADLDAVLDGRFTSRTGMGKGILGAQRLLPEHFHIETGPGRGTAVTLGKPLPPTAPPVTPDVLGRIAAALASFHAASPLEQIRKQSKAELRVSYEVLRSVLDTTLDGFWRLDVHGRLLDVNPAYCHQSGFTREELLGLQASALEAEEGTAGTETYLMHILETGGDRFEIRHRRKDGSIWHVEASATFGDVEGGQIIMFLRDITARKQAENDLKRYKAVLETSNDGFWMVDSQGVLLEANHAYAKLSGYTVDELRGKHISQLEAKEKSAAEVKTHMARVIDRGYEVFETLHRHKDGHPIDIEVSTSYITELQQFVAFCRDITSRKDAEKRIEHLAYYDPLTHLPNRRLLLDRLQQSIVSSMRSKRIGALLFIDLDNFKTLNDTLGHDIGDLLLQKVAERLTTCVREGDTVSRFGGDEFVVMLEHLEEEELDAAAQTEIIANKILAMLNRQYQLDALSYHSTPSIGATLYGARKQGIEELLKQADIAMYQAKNAGRNTFRFFDENMQKAINNRAELEEALKQAVDQNQFLLYYQIQVDNSHCPLGAEALIRWKHPNRGMVSPAQFIPLAEETGLIIPMGKWVLETACAQLKVWQNNALTQHLSLSVNVSAQQFHEANFVAHTLDAVRRHDINPKLLKLEPTETILLKNIEGTVTIMKELKALGIRFALDDFGTGFSSLQYLKLLPLDQLKIDQSFVMDLVTDSNDLAIVRTIISMAQSLGLEIIAEGVETEEQKQILLSNGCSHFQGYLFGRPMPIEQFEALLANNSKG